jgi:hypothetical protein
MTDPNVTRIHADLARVDQASTLVELSDLYEEIVGYDISEDDPTATADTVREMLTGFLREELSSYGG